jgi:hypothetical protein
MTRTEEVQMNNPPEGCKPFNLERALAGDPVVTRDGKPVTQLTLFNISGRFPLVGVVDNSNESWTPTGLLCANGQTSCFDLFMAPKKRTVWVNLYGSGFCHWYNTKAEADEASSRFRIGNRAWPLEIEERKK